MKIIFLNRFFYPDHSATSQMLSDLAFALSERRHTVEVITSRLSYDKRDLLKRRESVRGVTITRVTTTRFGRDHLLGRAIDYASFYATAFFSLMLRAERGTIIVAKTDPPMLSLLTLPVCAFKGAISINWLQDIFPEIAEVLGFSQGRIQKTAIFLLRLLRNISLKRAHLNVVLGEGMAAKLRTLGVPQSAISIIPNWASGTLIHPVDSKNNTLRKVWGLEGSFVVGYSGNLGRAHEIETFLASIEELEKREAVVPALEGATAEASTGAQPIQWLFIGGGAQMEVLKREVKRRELTSVMFKPYQPRALLSESLSVPDVHLISLRRELEGLIVPSKFYGIAAAGRPAIFVGHPDGELATIIKKHSIGFVACDGAQSLSRAILALTDSPDLAARQGARARQLFETEFDFPRVLASWEKALENAWRAQS